MKAIVVDDVKSMILIAAYAKGNNLPRLKVIPLDLIQRVRRSYLPNTDNAILGRLADFANSDYKELSDFLFGNTLLVKTATSAYLLSGKGHKAVTFEGELFEPLGTSMSLDFGSKISDLTRTILLGDSIISLRNSLGTLKRLIEKRDNELKQIVLKADLLKDEKSELVKEMNDLNTQFSSLSNHIREDEQDLELSLNANANFKSQYGYFVRELGKLHRLLSIVRLSIEYVSRNADNLGDLSVKSQLESITAERSQILSSLDACNVALKEALTSSGVLKSEYELGLDRIKNLDENFRHLESEQRESTLYVENLKSELLSTEARLQVERDLEDQVIASAGTSVSELRSFEQKIRTLQDIEKKLSKEHGSIEKEIALIKKDIANLESQEFDLLNDLRLLGYEDLLDSFDVDGIVDMLTIELEALKTRINQRADQVYVEVIEGYKGMSDKRNLLEGERHSIVRFVEEISTEKKKVFTDALKSVDNNLRQTFTEVTGGSAWLEAEYKEDEFPNGIMLMVQFQGKPGRESTALSGGEKTMAAIIFLLALQSIKPSPFYLMDEVDAHLDAPNTERLSRVLFQRSKENQMIMVTLKDATVAQAGLIYGIYSRSGVSQVIRYKPSSKLNPD
jgi:chromosome segregation protein